MANFQYAGGLPFRADGLSDVGDFATPSSTTLQNASPLAGSDVLNARTEHMEDAFFESGTGNMTIACQFPSAVLMGAVIIEGFNHQSARIASGSGSGLTGGFSETRSFGAGDYNPRTGRYSWIEVVPTNEGTRSWWGVDLSGGVNYGSNGQIGRISFVKDLHTIDQNWGNPYEWEVDWRGGDQTLPGGREFNNRTSEAYALVELHGQFARYRGDSNGDGDTILDDLHRIQRINTKDERYLLYDNCGNPAVVHICKKIEALSIATDGGIVEASLALREVL